MSELLKSSFAVGVSPEEFERTLGENAAVHRHYFERAPVDTFRDRIANIPELRIIVITEPWCLDTFSVIPPIQRLFEGNARAQIRFVGRDQNLELIDRYLTRGGRAIPKVVVCDAEFNEYFNWGPRPQPAQQIFEDHRALIAEGKMEKSEVHKLIRAFYARDRGATVLSEFLELLENRT